MLTPRLPFNSYFAMPSNVFSAASILPPPLLNPSAVSSQDFFSSNNPSRLEPSLTLSPLANSLGFATKAKEDVSNRANFTVTRAQGTHHIFIFFCIFVVVGHRHSVLNLLRILNSSPRSSNVLKDTGLSLKAIISSHLGWIGTKKQCGIVLGGKGTAVAAQGAFDLDHLMLEPTGCRMQFVHIKSVPE